VSPAPLVPPEVHPDAAVGAQLGKPAVSNTVGVHRSESRVRLKVPVYDAVQPLLRGKPHRVAELRGVVEGSPRQPVSGVVAGERRRVQIRSRGLQSNNAPISGAQPEDPVGSLSHARNQGVQSIRSIGDAPPLPVSLQPKNLSVGQRRVHDGRLSTAPTQCIGSIVLKQKPDTLISIDEQSLMAGS
jgi:hypothetical protein